MSDLLISIVVYSCIGLFLFYYLMQWRTNKQLKKLKEAYKPEDDISNKQYRGTTEAGSNPVISGKSDTQGITESERRELFQAAINNSVRTNQSESNEPKKSKRTIPKERLEEIKTLIENGTEEN